MASTDPCTVMAADLSSGGAGRERHCADVFVEVDRSLVCVMLGRDTTSDPPIRYNDRCHVVAFHGQW